jgi:signal transduction histidine kinase
MWNNCALLFEGHAALATLLMAAAALSALLAVLGVARRAATAAREFTLVVMAVFVWSTAYFFELVLPGLPLKLLSARLEYLGISTLPVLWMLLAARATGRGELIRPSRVAALFLVPVVTSCLAFTNGLHGLLWSGVWVDATLTPPLLVVAHGPWFWVTFGYSWLMLSLGTFLYAVSLVRSPPVFRSQALAMIIGVVAPAAANLLYVSGLNPFPGFDITPFAFSVSGCATAWALFRRGFLDMLPVARQRVLETMRDAVIVLDPEGRIVDINPAGRRLLPAARYPFGTRLGTLLGAWEQARPAHGLPPLPLPEIALGGPAAERWFEVDDSPVFNRHGRETGRVLVLHETTERRRMELSLRSSEESQRALAEQLHQARKMEAVGQLAGGIAHDFNNLLTAIGGFTELVLVADAVDAETRGWVTEIRTTIERGKNLVRQLLAFSRKQVMKPRPFGVNEMVSGTQKMLGRLIGGNVTLVTRLGAEPDLVCADPGQIELALVNLAVNARDAMPRGGTLTIETRTVAAGKGQPRGRVCLRVSDTGVGMDARVLSHLFEPFFTTKESGRGTGLGLSTVYGIVSQSGGTVEVASTSAAGTTFEIRLPLAEEPAAALRGSPAAPPAAAPPPAPPPPPSAAVPPAPQGPP